MRMMLSLQILGFMITNNRINWNITKIFFKQTIHCNKRFFHLINMCIKHKVINCVTSVINCVNFLKKIIFWCIISSFKVNKFFKFYLMLHFYLFKNVFNSIQWCITSPIFTPIPRQFSSITIITFLR